MLSAAFGLFVVAGVMAGLVSGLFGMGGGLAVVPMMVIALSLIDLGDAYVMHLSVGTSLVVMVLTSIYTTLLRGRAGDLDRTLLHGLLFPVAAGAAIGSAIGDALPGYVLRTLFICFVIYMIYRVFQRRRMARQVENSTGAALVAQVPTRMQFALYGLIGGLFGALLGIGVALVVTPFLTSRGYRMKDASAVAASMAIVVGLAAGTGYAIGGLNEEGLPAWSFGYVYLPAALGLVIGALAGSPLGIRLSHRLSDTTQFTLFLGYLVAVLIGMATR